MPETILTVDSVSKHYGAYELFQGVRFHLLERDRVALVGPNGAGKSTLLRIVAGLEQPDSGRIIAQRGLRIGYLPQEPAVPSGRSVLEAALDALSHVRALGEELATLAAALATVHDPAEQARLLTTYERVSTRFEAAGGYDLDVRARQVLAGLGFRDEELLQPVEQLSGGQRTRLALALSLIHISEPTRPY